MEKLVVVNRSDQVLGTREKLACHRRPETLHRAFAAFVVDGRGRLLLSKRSRKKSLWPLSWDNSCSSHPHIGETYKEAGERRLPFELGFTTPLRYVYKFSYQANYNGRLAEHEVCAVLVGRADGQVRPNADEIAAVRWVEFDSLKHEIGRRPLFFTPWLKMVVERMQSGNGLLRHFLVAEKGGEHDYARG